MKKHLLLAIAIVALASLAPIRTASAATAIEDYYIQLQDGSVVDVGFIITITHRCLEDLTCPKNRIVTVTCDRIEAKARLLPRIQAIVTAGDLMAANAKTVDDVDQIDADTIETLAGAVYSFTACGQNRSVARTQ